MGIVRLEKVLWRDAGGEDPADDLGVIGLQWLFCRQNNSIFAHFVAVTLW
jgi:hypothetical protein